VKLLLVDDHPIVRAGVRRLLAVVPDIEVVEAADGRAALAAFRQDKPDIVVLDLNLPGIGGIELLRRFVLEEARVLIFSMHAEPLYVTNAIQAGAMGYVSKTAPPDEILEAVTKVAAGGRYIEREIAQELALSGQPQPQLTPRDIEILRLLAKGDRLGEIATTIGVSYKTVANTVSLIKTKLGAGSTTELVRIAIESGLS
jgi:DNA-binding NarL/FixJ family response regulator